MRSPVAVFPLAVRLTKLPFWINTPGLAASPRVRSRRLLSMPKVRLEGPLIMNVSGLLPVVPGR